MPRTDDAGRDAIDSGLRDGLADVGRARGDAVRERRGRSHILVTHYHWDHIQGIPFFAPLYSEKNHFHFYSFRSKFLGRDSLKQVFETQMALPYFPVNISAMNAKRKFQEVAGGDAFHDREESACRRGG